MAWYRQQTIITWADVTKPLPKPMLMQIMQPYGINGPQGPNSFKHTNWLIFNWTLAWTTEHPSEIWIKTPHLYFKKIHFDMSPAMWQPFCLGLEVWSYTAAVPASRFKATQQQTPLNIRGVCTCNNLPSAQQDTGHWYLIIFRTNWGKPWDVILNNQKKLKFCQG